MKMTMRFYALWLIIAVLGRLVPHLPNITPFTNLSLIAGKKLKFFPAAILILLGLLLSDLILACLYHYPILGYWSFFTYSGFLICACFGQIFARMHTLKNWLLVITGLSFAYWLWTNLGVWCFSGFYTHDLAGLFSCYYLALPFLRNALIGDLGWFLIIHFAYRGLGMSIYSDKSLIRI